MGIPSYFAQVIKKTPGIVEPAKRVLARERFDALYMDCNSIVYDAVRALEEERAAAGVSLALPAAEAAIVARVMDVIAGYVALVRPAKVAYISFDGVAPRAKMEQQRARRAKAAFVESIDFGDRPAEPARHARFSTAAITPGTGFMAALSIAANARFRCAPCTIVSASDEPGEGEHKMFAHLRATVEVGDTVAVYGLDADLIMLSLVHRRRCRGIFVFREAPAFIGSILPGAEPSAVYFLDIGQLGREVALQMGGAAARPEPDAVNDYIFMCFMLGNDFMPHFPALNIRTQGIEVLEALYQRVVAGHAGRGFIKDEKIQWRWVAIFVGELAKMEHELVLKEYKLRAKFDHRSFREGTPEEKRLALENAPILFRGTEAFIAPKESWWESRYYEALLHMPREETAVCGVCVNYLEGLEWCWRYYTSPCPSWTWHYRWAYPPLLCDLARYVPRLDTEFVLRETPAPVSAHEQLCYVLPAEMRHLIPEGLRVGSPSAAAAPRTFQWAFCRYFWEAHAAYVGPESELESASARRRPSPARRAPVKDRRAEIGSARSAPTSCGAPLDSAPARSRERRT